MILWVWCPYESSKTNLMCLNETIAEFGQANICVQLFMLKMIRKRGSWFEISLLKGTQLIGFTTPQPPTP